MLHKINKQVKAYIPCHPPPLLNRKTWVYNLSIPTFTTLRGRDMACWNYKMYRLPTSKHPFTTKGGGCHSGWTQAIYILPSTTLPGTNDNFSTIQNSNPNRRQRISHHALLYPERTIMSLISFTSPTRIGNETSSYRPPLTRRERKISYHSETPTQSQAKHLLTSTTYT